MSARSVILGFIRSLGLMRVVNALSNGWYWGIKRAGALRHVNDIDAVYGRRYFRAETDMTEPTATRVVDVLMESFSPRSCADVGCGTAVYLRDMEQRGVEVQGFEGSRHAIDDALLGAERILQHDLRTPLHWDRTYDLVISFEVGEHLPAGAADVFVRSIADLGDKVVFSAALPGQGGTDHINEQPSSYWIDKFQTCGMQHDDEATTRLRNDMKRLDCVWWLQTNLLVFKRTGGQ